MAYDDVFQYIGSFGRYQKWIYFWQTLPVVFGAIQTLLPVFILYTPDHRCSLPSRISDTFAIQDHFHEILINQSVPRGKTHDGEDHQETFSKCNIFQHALPVGESRINGTLFSKTEHYDFNATTDVIVECNDWVYDKTTFYSTFVTENNLVCSRKLHRTHATMAYFGGFTVGSVVVGILADAFGRKKGLLLSFILHIGSNIPLGFVADYHIFAALRFVSGVSSAGMVQTSYVMNMELVGPDSRMIAGMVFQIFWGAAMILLDVAALAFRDWKTLNLVISAPTVLFLLYIWILPESARWLMTKQRSDEAYNILQKVARKNKRHFNEKILLEQQNSNSCGSLWKICSSPKLVVRTIIICLNWLVVAMQFNGLSLNTGNLSGNVFLNFFLISLAEIAGFVICIPLLNRVGRKPIYVGALLVGGIALTLTIFPVLYAQNEAQWATIALSILGKIGASAAFGIVFLYSSEFFPTIVRNSAIGMCAFCGRIGGMISPYVSDLDRMVEGQFGRALPLAVFGISSIVAGILALYLPETRGRALPESIEDTINYEGKKTFTKVVEAPKGNVDQCRSCESVLIITTAANDKNEGGDTTASTADSTATDEGDDTASAEEQQPLNAESII